jgi:CubicO group peptidase (beta-lactamase class C family)
VDDLVTPFFPDYQPIAGLDADKQALTVRDLLTMRTGLDWSEALYAGSPLDRLNTCGCDWVRFVLDWPMREPPGSRWEYVSGGVILLGAVIGRASGTRVDLLLDRDLFFLVVPGRRLVVASTAESSDARWAAAVEMLYDYILPATGP